MELAINHKHYKRYSCIKFIKHPCFYLFFHKGGFSWGLGWLYGVFNNKIYK